MITPRDDPLHSPKLRIQRAKRHIQDLHAEIEASILAKPYSITKNLIAVCARLGKSFPDAVETIAGDAISNLRAALDQLTCALAIANKRGPL